MRKYALVSDSAYIVGPARYDAEHYTPILYSLPAATPLNGLGRGRNL